MTDATNFGIADHHFENAGIELEDKTTETVDETNLESGGSEEPKLEEAKADTASDAASADSTSSGTDGKPEPKQEEKAPVANRSEAELDQEQYSELVNGKPVRPEVAGRWMHQRNTARQERDAVNGKYNEAVTKATQLEGQVEAYKTAATAMSSLAPADIPKAVKVYTQLLQNPVATLKQMLVEAKAMGHNIDGIGEGVDTAAIQKMLDQRLAGIEKPKEQNQVQQVPTVDNDDDLFVKSYPDAVHHMDIYVDMLDKNPKLSNTELYFTVKNWADSNGYDYSKPLKPQIDARKNPTQNANPIKQAQTQDNTPRLNGTGSLAPELLITPGGKEESYKDIVRRAIAASQT